MIKFITSFLSLLWVLLAGTPAPVNDLRKKPTRETSNMQFYAWINKNFYIIALAALILFVIICFMIVGGSATESGTLYNQLGGTI